MNLLKKNKIKILAAIYCITMIYGITYSFFTKSTESFSTPVMNKNIIIDAGHGGWDPGKVSPDNTKEKDVNLNISMKLQKFLEEGGASVFTTRAEDTALSEKKIEDLSKRKELANGEDIDIFISIHQNSFPQNSVKGAQVFYYKNSESSKKLAEHIQNKIKSIADIDNKRVAKANGEYYILKNTKSASVIVECGFLSNSEENSKLKSEEYQKKIAWAIYMGIIDYCTEENFT